MASSLPRVIDDDLLQCKLCCRKAVDPKLLPCLHVFCGRCLDRHLAKSSVLEHRQTVNDKPKSDSNDKSAFDGNDGKPDLRDGTCPDISQEKRNKKQPPVEETPAFEEDDSYEIPQRTIDEYGYQIADEDAFRDGLVYDNEDVDTGSYYNRTTPSVQHPVQTYTDMTNQAKKRTKRWKKSSKRSNASANVDGIQVRTMRTMSELSGEYVQPGGEGNTPGTCNRCPSDIYDNIDDPLGTGNGSPRLSIDPTADRKCGSPSDVRRWKVSSATAPPLLVRRPKGSRNVVDRAVAPPVASVTAPSDLRKEEREMAGATVKQPFSRSAALQDIYAKGDSSPPIADLYGSTSTEQASTAVYKLQMRISGDFTSRVQPVTGLEHVDEVRHIPPVEGDESGIRCKRFQCPVCEEPVTMTEDGSFAMCSFVGAMQEMSSFYTEGQTRCSNCEFKPATYLCFDCRHNFCHGCREAHNWLKITKSHRVVSLLDVRLGKHQNELQDMIASRCYEHTENVAEFLCITCQRIVCAECLTSTEHDDHWAAPIDDVAIREKDYIETLMESVKRNLDKVTLERNKLDSYRLRSDEDRMAVMRDIVVQKETLTRLVETFCASLVEKVEKEYAKERRRIDDGLIRLDRFRMGMQHSHKVVGQLLDHGRATDIAVLSKAVRSRLQALGKASPPVTVGALGVAFRPTVIAADDIEQMFGVLTLDRPDLAGSTKNLSLGDTEADASTVTPRLLRSFPTKTASDDKGCRATGVAVVPESDEVVLVDDINKKIKVFRADGALQRELCPSGEHRLIDPWDVVVLRGETGTGSLLAVTDRGARDVKVFTDSGEFRLSFGPHFGNPWGIATNSIGNILVTDITHRKVFVHDATGNLLFSIPSQKPDRTDASLRCPEYVAVNANDDVVVSDFELHSVLIYDKFGRFVTRYGDRNEMVRKLNVPCGVTVDREGDIYIADYNKRRIVRLTRNGRLRCHYATNDTHLVMPQALVFNCDGSLVVVDRTHVEVFAITEDCIDGSDQPKPKPRRKTEEVRRKSNPSKKKNSTSTSQTMVSGVTSLSLDGINGTTKVVEGPEESGESQSIVKQFLETEVW